MKKVVITIVMSDEKFQADFSNNDNDKFFDGLKKEDGIIDAFLATEDC
jgi:hypothetical protein